MGKAFFYLRNCSKDSAKKLTEKKGKKSEEEKKKENKAQILYLGLRTDGEQFAVPTGVKIAPKHWDFGKKEVKNVTMPELDLAPHLLDKCLSQNRDVISFTNNFLDSLQHFANTKTYLPKEQLKIEIEAFVNGRNELEQFALEMECFIKGCINEKGMTKEKLIESIDLFLHPPAKQLTLFEFIEKTIDDSINGRRLKDGQKLHDRTIKKYLTTLELLKDFQRGYARKVEFETIDLDFYKDFVAYMNDVKNYKPATLGKHISIFKTFMREATEEGLNTNLKYQSKSFKAIEDKSDSIYLTDKELAAMYRLDLSDSPRLDKVRDLFLIGANTGLRFSDFTSIKPHHLKQTANGLNIEIIQYKTKQKVIVPVNDMVLTILKKYNNQLPEAISNQKFNDYIKEIAKRVSGLQVLESKVFVKGGKEYQETYHRWELVTTHTARRSFATNEYKRGKPSNSIMAITGHETEKSFLAYLKLTKTEHAEILRTNNH